MSECGKSYTVDGGGLYKKNKPQSISRRIIRKLKKMNQKNK